MDGARRPVQGRRWLRPLALLAGALAAAGAWVAWVNVRGEAPPDTAAPQQPAAADIERGAYLARAGNCVGCHTVPGGAAFAGGRGVDTPFGAVVAPNITSDAATGIGDWSAADFWRALHHGRSRNGRLLYPAFPYPSFTHVTRADSDALFAYLRTVPAVNRANAPHRLRFPYSSQAALAVWRALYFRPGGLSDDPARDAGWNRGRYLVLGLGHCAACHSGRDFLGGTRLNAEFAGGLMPDAGWYAPSLATPREAGAQGGPRQDVIALLRDGVSGQASASGPMAEVVYSSTQFLTDADLGAMADYLASIPIRDPAPRAPRPAGAGVLTRGGEAYAEHCASCHGENGQGAAGSYPALAGNRAVTLDAPNNVIQAVRHGGYMPTTAGNPRPYGMAPYGQVLGSDEIAAVATFIRQSWGNAAPAVSPVDVLKVR